MAADPTNDRPITITLPRNVLMVFADMVGGTDRDTWGPVAHHYGVSEQQLGEAYGYISAAAQPPGPAPRCETCGDQLIWLVHMWTHRATPDPDHRAAVPAGTPDPALATPEGRIAATLKLHTPDDEGSCRVCVLSWAYEETEPSPCPTFRTLTGIQS